MEEIEPRQEQRSREQLPRVSVGLEAIIGEKMDERQGGPSEYDRAGQDFGVKFVVTRAKSAGNGCSRVRDFWEKGVYSSIHLLADAYSPTAVATLLAKKCIVASPSHFDGCRLLGKLGIDPDDGLLRISFAHYNTKEETLRLIDALESILGS